MVSKLEALLGKAIEHLNSNLRPGDGCSPDCKVEALYESGPDSIWQFDVCRCVGLSRSCSKLVCGFSVLRCSYISFFFRSVCQIQCGAAPSGCFTAQILRRSLKKMCIPEATRRVSNAFRRHDRFFGMRRLLSGWPTTSDGGLRWWQQVGSGRRKPVQERWRTHRETCWMYTFTNYYMTIYLISTVYTVFLNWTRTAIIFTCCLLSQYRLHPRLSCEAFCDQMLLQPEQTQRWWCGGSWLMSCTQYIVRVLKFDQETMLQVDRTLLKVFATSSRSLPEIVQLYFAGWLFFELSDRSWLWVSWWDCSISVLTSGFMAVAVSQLHP